MDSDEYADEYGDDLADEDLVEALREVAKNSAPQSTVLGPSNFNRVAPQRPVAGPKAIRRLQTTTASRSRAQVPAANPTRASSSFESVAEEDYGDFPLEDLFSSQESLAVPSERQIAGPSLRQVLQHTNAQPFRQTNLFGERIGDGDPRTSQPGQGRVYRADLSETPTHHELDPPELQTWVYPTNLGAIRDYQYSIVKNCLFNNTLVALPTGLGKTFIAATVMLNFYRWTKNAKIVFVAPTKPLTAQQVDACFNIVGIPRSQTTLLTGETSPVIREDEWAEKRVFFMTPQTLLNDMSKGYADAKSIVLLVVDEAHRAVGEYAYAKVVKFMRRFNTSFRVLALTATPGSKIETVQEVIDNLGISHIEIRTEESIDIRQYVHRRDIETVVLDPSDEIYQIREMFTKALKPLADKLFQQNKNMQRDPMNFTAYGLLIAQREWQNSAGRQVPQPVKFMIMALFSLMSSIAHSIKLLNFHGIRPFFDNLKHFRSETEEKGDRGSKYKWQLLRDPNFQEMMVTVEKWLKTDGFVGHPKMTALTERILNHFMDNGNRSGTRVIVFSEYRDSAEEIVRILNRHKPLISATVFVGQADSKRSEGMKQAEQIRTIENFKKGEFNVLVATSIGEEGLDIGQVDLIICYDASASPIRMLQRMGRTGRKRAGNIVLLLMRDKEERQYEKSKDSYEAMQKLICEGSRFNFRHDLSSRIVPRGVQPQVDKKHIDIPIENTQNSALPEPRKRKAAVGRKRAPKKFHMPDGVETGFMRASTMEKFVIKNAGRPKTVEPREMDYLADIPALEDVLLSEQDLNKLNRTYRELPGERVEEVEPLSLTSHPTLQRRLGPISKVRHGELTKRCVKLFNVLGQSQSLADRWKRPYGEADTSRYHMLPMQPFADHPGGNSTKGGSARQKRIMANAEPGNSESGEDVQPKRHKSVQTRNGQDALFADGSEAEEGVSEDEEDFDPPPRRRRRKEGPKNSLKNRSSGWRGNGIGSSEIGDDCERDSDVVADEDSDSGADLLDFVVSDGHLSSSMKQRRSTSPTSVTMSQRSSSVGEQPFYVPRAPPATQGTDDSDMPNLSQMLLRGAKAGPVAADESGEDDVGESWRIGRRKIRAVLDDSDSDE